MMTAEVHVRCGYCGKVLPVKFPKNDHKHRFAMHVCRHGVKKQGFCPLSAEKEVALGIRDARQEGESLTEWLRRTNHTVA